MREIGRGAGPQATRLVAVLLASLLYAGALFIWLLVQPGNAPLTAVLAPIALLSAPLVALLLSCWNGRTLQGFSRGKHSADFVPLLSFIGFLCLTIALGIVAYSALRAITLPPVSPADVFLLSSYGFFIAVLILLPRNQAWSLPRVRTILDGLLVLIALVAISWPLTIGPTLFDVQEPRLARLIDAAYPFLDMVLLTLVLLLWTRAPGGPARLTFGLASVAMFALAISDSISQYQSLQGSTSLDSPLTAVSVLGILLAGLATASFRAGSRALQDEPDATRGLEEPVVPRLRQVLLPYVVLPPMALLALVTWQRNSDPRFTAGVVMGMLLVSALVLVRQFVILRENLRLYAQVRHQALHDSLTGLPNREFLQHYLTEVLATASSETRIWALLLLDLNRFKEINDTFGHLTGDAVLQNCAYYLEAAAPQQALVARLGGDEFAMFLPVCAADAALLVAETLVESIQTPLRIEGHAFQVGASVGVALWPQHGQDPTTLLRCADVAMYVAKRAGVSAGLYEPDEDHHGAERLALAAALRQALLDRNLRVYYQPKVDLQDGTLIGMEALVRWRDPDRGWVSPGVFVPLAEHHGMIIALTRFVLEEAAAQCAAWRTRGWSVPVAVNLSIAGLRDGDLLNMLGRLIDAHQLSPGSLRLEITESTLMASVTHSLEIITRIAALGIPISVDDFGTGYSSLAYLKHLPVDELKVDMGFVQGMLDDEADRSIVASTIGLAHSLGLRVVAEGVEQRETAALLARLRCDSAQGFYFGRPMPAADVARWREEWASSPAPVVGAAGIRAAPAAGGQAEPATWDQQPWCAEVLLVARQQDVAAPAYTHGPYEITPPQSAHPARTVVE